MRARRHPAFRRSTLALAALSATLAAGPAAAATCTWNAAGGNWNALANWLACVAGNGNPGGTPGTADTAIIGAAGVVAVTNAQGVNALNNAGVINVAATGSLLLNAGGGGTVNSGTINVADGGALSFDGRAGTHSLSGGGSFVLGGPGSRIWMEGSGTTTLAAGTTIRGAGQIGQAIALSGAMNFVNNGLISADVSGQSLILLAPGNAGGYTNNARLEARNGGTLQLNAGVAQGAAGVIKAENGSAVLLNSITVSGGTLDSAGTGVIRATNTNANLLSGGTIAGVVDLASGASQLRLANTTTLNGRIDVGGSGNLYIDNRGSQGLATTQAINGTGSINLAGGALRFEGSGQTTIGSGITVAGSGAIGQATLESGTHTLINNGLISANVNGQTLTLQRIANGGAAVQNNGILEATGGGTLRVQADVVGNSGSQMRAGAGSTILLDSVTVSGIVNTTGAGNVTATNTNANLFSNVTLNGVVDLASGASQLRLANNAVINGRIDVGGSGNLYIDNRGSQGLATTQTIGGPATINLAGGALRFEGSGQTTLASNVVVAGYGEFGRAIIESGGHTLINNGLISANTSGQTLNLQPIANGAIAVQNNGILEATGGGTLLLSANVANAGSSQLRANAGSSIVMNGVTISGIVNTTGSGKLTSTNDSRNLFDNVTLNGNVDLASGASQLRLANNAVINGSIDVGGSGNLYIDNRTSAGLAGTQSITGTGSINLAGGALRMEGAGATSTTIGPNVVVRGYGTAGQAIIQSGAMTLVNTGTFSADVSGQTLIMQTPGNGGVWNNQALFEARNGGTLRLDGDVNQSASGVIRAQSGSSVLLNSNTVSGGVLDSVGTGAIRATNTNANLLSNTTINGVVDLASSASQLRLANNAVLNGRIDVGSSGNLYLDARGSSGLSTTPTIGGSGSINLSGGAIRVEGTGQTTLASGVTVAGFGTFGQAIIQSGTHTLINNGTINANVAGQTLTLQSMANNGGITGTGTLRVDGGTMSIATGRGTSQGVLDVRATGTVLTNNQNITLSGDFTNAQSGAGNAFFNRAGFVGSGQVLAGGSAAQVITGGAVTGGTTTNATLTIGSVRVGANNFDYQVANGGASGPTLRGAVQTSVNGANITDARLSGTGVTASNFNAGGPGGSGETRTVTFTVGSAGALAPMTGQVLNLRSNFDNIADQKLNIVLASGAAAYNAAVGSTTTPVVLANQRVGGTGSATLAISNTAAAGAFSEDLNAGIAGVSGAATATGSVTGRIAGTSNTGSGAITVGVNTATAGAKTGVVNLAYQTAGTVAGVSNGLAAASAGGQAVNVSGNVYQTAAGQLVTAPLNFGTIQVGQTVSQNLAVRNIASGASGFVEDLNASFGSSGNAQISGAGSLSGIRAGTTSTAANGTMTVTVNATTVGALNSAIAVNYVSAGAVNGVSNGLGTLAVGSEAYGVNGIIEATGAVINQASPLVNTPVVNLGAVRVGAASPGAAVSVTNVATVAPQAALNAVITPTSGPITASGSFNLLNPGANDATSLRVGLNTATAGNFTGAGAGTATIAFVSDASNVGGCAPSCTLDLAPQTVRVEGKVYTAAAGQLATGSVNFGVVRVGDTVSARNITIDNTAAVTALNDTLRADVSGLTGPFSGNGAVSGIGAGASGTRGIGLNTSAAGVYSGRGTVSFLSQNADMADVSAGADATLSVFAQVNNLANGDFDLLSGAGTLTQSGTDYVLDLGTLVVGSTISAVLQLDNDVSGPADVLSGLFDLSAANDFSFGGWGAVGPLGAGAATGPLTIDWLAGATGLFTDSILFNGLGTNASDTAGLAQTRRLTIRALVVGDVPPGTVPEPSSLLLLVAAGSAAWWARRRSAVKGAAQ